MDETLSKTQQRRLEKKTKRKEHRLARLEQVDTGEMFSRDPTRTLCIQNGGYLGWTHPHLPLPSILTTYWVLNISAACMVRQEKLEEAMQGFGVARVFQPLGKPFAFVTFDAVEDAVRAQRTLHGVRCESLEKVLLVQFAMDAWFACLIHHSSNDAKESLPNMGFSWVA